MSKKNKKILGFIFIFAGGASFMFFLFSIFIGIMSEKAIERSHEIFVKFNRAAGYVDGFKEFNHRLPTQTELTQYLKDSEGIQLNNDMRDPEVPDFVKEKPQGSYFLSYWRGEWAEYYAGWNKQTTLVFDRSLYFPFNSILLTVLAVLFSTFILYIGIKIVR